MSITSAETKKSLESDIEREFREDEQKRLEERKKRDEKYLEESKQREEEWRKRDRQFQIEMAKTMNNALLPSLLAMQAKASDSSLTADQRKELADNANKLKIMLLQNTASLSGPNSVLNQELQGLKAQQRVNERTNRELEFDRIFSVIFSKIGGRIDPEDIGHPTVVQFNQRYFSNEHANLDYTKEGFPRILELLMKFLALSKPNPLAPKKQMTERAFREAFARTKSCLSTLSAEQFLQIIKLFTDCKAINHFSLDKVDCDYGTIFGEALAENKWEQALGLMRFGLTTVMGSDLEMTWGGPMIRTKMWISGGNPTPPGHEKGEKLMAACKEGNADRVRSLIMNEGADSNYVDSFGQTPLIAAKNADVVMALIAPDMPMLESGKKIDTSVKMDISKRANVNYVYEGNHKLGPRLSPLPHAVSNVAETGVNKIKSLCSPKEVTKETLTMGLMEILSILDQGSIALEALNALLWRFKDVHSVEEPQTVASTFYDSPFWARPKTFDKQSFSVRGGRRVYNPFNATFLGALVHRLMYNNTQIVTETIHQMIELMVKEGADISCTDLLESNALFFAIENAEYLGTKVVKTLLASESLSKSFLLEAHSKIKEVLNPKIKAELEEIFKPRMQTLTKKDHKLFALIKKREKLLAKKFFNQLKTIKPKKIVVDEKSFKLPPGFTAKEQKAHAELLNAMEKDCVAVCEAAKISRDKAIEKIDQLVDSYNKVSYRAVIDDHFYKIYLWSILDAYPFDNNDTLLIKSSLEQVAYSIKEIIFDCSYKFQRHLLQTKAIANPSSPTVSISIAQAEFIDADIFEICRAAQKAQVEGIEKLKQLVTAFKARHGENANIHAYHKGLAAIHYAAQKGDVDSVIFLDSQSNIDGLYLPSQLPNKTTVLQYLIKAGKSDLYIKKKAEFDEANPQLVRKKVTSTTHTTAATYRSNFKEKFLSDSRFSTNYQASAPSNTANASTRTAAVPLTAALAKDDAKRYMKPPGQITGTSTVSQPTAVLSQSSGLTSASSISTGSYEALLRASEESLVPETTPATASASSNPPLLTAAEQYKSERENMDKLYEICSVASKVELESVKALVPGYIKIKDCSINTVYKDKHSKLQGTILHYACQAKATDEKTRADKVNMILYLEGQGANINIRAAGKSSPAVMLEKDKEAFALYQRLKKEAQEAQSNPTASIIVSTVTSTSNK